MKLLFYLVFIYLFLNIHCAQNDITATTAQLIVSQGYTVEQHWVYTEDDFVLGVQRIPFGKSGQNNTKVVILQHGLLDTSATWVINSASQSLGFILADEGYDVWLPNVRGNTYSMGSANWDPTDPQFWDFSWDTHAMLDLPAVISYVIELTKVKNVSIVAHSQGATTGIALLCSNYTVSTQVNVMVALAPVTYLNSQRSVLLASLATIGADRVMSLLGNKKFSPTPGVLDNVLGIVCEITPKICNDIMGSLFGTSHQLNASRMDVYTGHWPDQTSVKNLVQWIQNARSKQFARYDKSIYFPEYLGVPVAVFYGDGDYLADSQDIQTLTTAAASHVVLSKLIPGYTHMDFTWASSAANLVYPGVLQILKKYNA